MSEQGPKRLLEDASTLGALRAALDAGRDERPSEAQLASLAASLGPLLGPGGGPSGPSGPPADPSPTAVSTAAGGSSIAAKGLGALAIAAAIATGAALMLREPAPTPSGPTRVEAPARPEPDPEPSIPEGLDVPTIVEAAPPPRAPEPPRATRPPAEAPSAPSHEVDPAAELALIRSAQDALRTSPSRALSLSAEHERRFGDGTLAQEREVVAIEALVRLARDGEARARAERFHARWPRSAHGRRVDVIVGG